MAQLEHICLRPLLTEKATRATEKANRYAFEVALRANKNQIKNAVEKLFDVKVLNVKTCVVPGKVKRHGKTTKKTSSYKKAFVQLESGQKIEFFKGI